MGMPFLNIHINQHTPLRVNYIALAVVPSLGLTIAYCLLTFESWYLVILLGSWSVCMADSFEGDERTAFLVAFWFNSYSIAREDNPPPFR